MRIIQLSDIHVWRYTYNPLHLLNKRLIGIASLLAGRAANFRLERLDPVIERVRSLGADHLLITGDLTTTALPGEFRDARKALDVLLGNPARVSVIPGNHDRYTTGSVRSREFETHFGEFAPSREFPWLRWLDHDTAILGLDPTRSHLSARGLLPGKQLAAARRLLDEAPVRPRRLIVASHYPDVAPPTYAHELQPKRMRNANQVVDWLAGVGPHLYCCGHVHAAWAFVPPSIPNQLCVNSGAPLLRDPTGLRPPGFLDIELHGSSVTILHHAWINESWDIHPLFQNPTFFEPAAVPPAQGANLSR